MYHEGRPTPESPVGLTRSCPVAPAKEIEAEM